MSLEEFADSEYSQKYNMDASNIYWGQELNDSHVFDVYSAFTQDYNSVKVRLDMLTFIAKNAERYKWDCYIYFKMHGILLDKWINKMTYWGSRADELSLYALSDMMNLHTFVVTGSKPWTTIHPNVIGTELEMLDLCLVKLIHLGQYMFGWLVPKLYQALVPAPLPLNTMIGGTSSQVHGDEPTQETDGQTSVPPLALPTPYDELETAHTLADMTVQTDHQIQIQELVPSLLSTPLDFPMATPPPPEI